MIRIFIDSLFFKIKPRIHRNRTHGYFGLENVMDTQPKYVVMVSDWDSECVVLKVFDEDSEMEAKAFENLLSEKFSSFIGSEDGSMGPGWDEGHAWVFHVQEIGKHIPDIEGLGEFLKEHT